MSETPSIRNGIDVDEIGRVYQEASTSDPVTVKVQTQHQWEGSGAFAGHGETIEVPALSEAMDRTHRTFRTDVPLVFGGTDTAAAPGETILAALAGCVGATLVQAAAVENLDLDAVDVSVDAKFDLRGTFDLGGRPGFTGISIVLGVRADADDETLEQLGRESVRLSPTADSLTNPVPITVTVQRLTGVQPA